MFWTMSPESSDRISLVHGSNPTMDGHPSNSTSQPGAIRPVITIKANLIVNSGIGTESSPYKLLIPEV